MPAETIECPLCLGKGDLKRAEVLERLGMKDFARVAQLSAEEAVRLLLERHKSDEQEVWSRFEAELTRRIGGITERHKEELRLLQNEKSRLELRLRELASNQDAVVQNAREAQRLETETQLRNEINVLDGRIKELEAVTKLADDQKAVEVKRVRAELETKLRSEQSQKEDLNRRVEDYFKEVSQLRERNKELEAEMAKVARVGKKEEMEFADEARTWPGIWISEKLGKNGDYLLAFRDASGAAVDPRMVVDNKDKESMVTEGDIKKLIRDAKERRIPVGVIVTKDEAQLRQIDRACRWGQEDGVWLLRSTRTWLPRDLEVLRPVFERMRVEGPDFLQKNAALAEEIRRTFVDIDEIEKELKKAAKAIDAATGLTTKYRERVEGLCAAASAQRLGPCPVLPRKAVVAGD